MTSLGTRPHQLTKSPAHQITKSIVVVAVFTAILIALAATLRPDAFFVGDQGIKLAAARNAIRFPSHPLNVPLPVVAGDPLPHVEPFFVVHNDHAHAITSEIFPLVSAPLLAALGLRGLYVLPAVGFIVTLFACGWLATTLDPRRSAALVAVVAALGTPFLFYGLEFWEHMPALALGTAGAALLLDAAARRPGAHASSAPTFAAGLLMGAAIVLRTEAACFVAATVIASRTLVHRPTWRDLGVAAGGVALALLPMTAWSLLHFGSLIPAHVSANAGLVNASWWTSRLELLASWLGPSRWTLNGPLASASIWSVAPAAAIALVSGVRSYDFRERGALWLLFGLTVLLVVGTAPNGGGSQWGPRYLLFAYVPLVILAADFVQALPRNASARIALVTLVLVCAWVQRAAYRELRGTKALYGQIVDFVERSAAPGVPVVSDLWWLDQLASPALEGRTFLFADRAQTGIDLVRRLSDHTVPTTTIVRSRDESPDIGSWSNGTCYFEEARDELAVRGLVAIRLRHRCGYDK
jgi:hypothetical protein